MLKSTAHPPTNSMSHRRIPADCPTAAALDSNPIYRDGLDSVFSRADEFVWLGSTGAPEEVLRLCDRRPPSVVLVDSAADPGFHLCRMLAGMKRGPAVVAVLQEMHQASWCVERALQAGVHGMVPRLIRTSELLELIHKAATGERVIAPSLMRLAPSEHIAVRADAQLLSRREFQVLQLAAVGMNNHAIAGDLHLSVETVRTHIKSIFRKLGAKDRTQAVALAYQHRLVSLREATDDLPLPRLA